jgi:hypothetical protein
MTAIGPGLVMTTAVVTETPALVAAAQPAALPSQAATDACNQRAAAQSSQRSNTKEIVMARSAP